MSGSAVRDGPVRGQELFGLGPTLEHDRGRPGDEVEDRRADGGVRPVDEHGAGLTDEDVVRANVPVDQRLPVDRFGPTRFELRQAGEVHPRTTGRAPMCPSQTASSAQPPKSFWKASRAGSRCAAGLGVSVSWTSSRAFTTASSSARSHGCRGTLPSIASKASATHAAVVVDVQQDRKGGQRRERSRDDRLTSVERGRLGVQLCPRPPSRTPRPAGTRAGPPHPARTRRADRGHRSARRHRATAAHAFDRGGHVRPGQVDAGRRTGRLSVKRRRPRRRRAPR